MTKLPSYLYTRRQVLKNIIINQNSKTKEGTVTTHVIHDNKHVRGLDTINNTVVKY